jgi:hypothetical protein
MKILSPGCYIFLLIQMLTADIAFSQADSSICDSLVHFAELRFVSPDEKQAFDHIDSSLDVSYFNLALNARVAQSAQINSQCFSQYKDLIDRMESGNFLSLKEEKQAKYIYSKVQDEMLKKYNLNTTFDQLFTKGDYNCVTATMLYGIILHKYRIPYEIKETPEHVYLVAKSGSKSTLMESTSPTQGYVSYNEMFKEHFIEYLKESKIISTEEIVKQGIDSIFSHFFFPHTSITLKQLAGVQYYNNAIFLMQSSDFKTALDQLQKSYFLYPSEKSRYLIQTALAVLLMNASYLQEEDWNYFIYITRHKSGILTDEALKSEFGRLTQKILVDKSQVQKYQQAYQFIIKNISDSMLRRDISFIYNFETGRYYLTTNRISEAFPYIEEAYKLNQDNYEVQNLFINTFIAILESYNDEEGIDALEKYYVAYETLRNDSRITGMLTGVYLFKASSFYENEQWNEGDIYLNKFEEMMNRYPDNKGLSYQIENVYTRIAAHYFRLNNRQKSKEYILRGLKYYPDSYRLKSSLETIK